MIKNYDWKYGDKIRCLYHDWEHCVLVDEIYTVRDCFPSGEVTLLEMHECAKFSVDLFEMYEPYEENDVNEQLNVVQTCPDWVECGNVSKQDTRITRKRHPYLSEGMVEALHELMKKQQ